MLQASSPLMLSDHLLRLAEETDDAGFRTIAETLSISPTGCWSRARCRLAEACGPAGPRHAAPERSRIPMGIGVCMAEMVGATGIEPVTPTVSR